MFKPILLKVDFPAFDALKPPGWQPDWDIFHGTWGDDWFGGGSGNDTMWGSIGADTFEGGAGSDTVNYSNSGGGYGVHVNLASGHGSRGLANGDRYESVENVVGTGFSDEIIGSTADNTIWAGQGNDIIWLSDGSDTIDGGGGRDVLFGITDGAGIDLETGTGTIGIALGDRYSNIEDVVLFGDNNTVTGDTANNWIAGRGANFLAFGGDGDDRISVVAQGGSLNGGAGIDTLDFDEFDNITGCKSHPTFGVVVDLDGGQAYNNNFGGGPVQTIANFENVLGTSASDVFYENSADNFFFGGQGQDTFVFDHDFSGERDVIADFEIGIDIIDLDDTAVRDFADLLSPGSRFMEQVGNDTVIHTGNGNEILLQGITTTDLSATDFLF